MRLSRQAKILEIIKSEEIGTQGDLVQRLKENGYDATQATVSRDINELNLVKIPGKKIKSKYAPKLKESQAKFKRILKEIVVDAKSAENIIVVHTLTGCANAAGEAIDNSEHEAIVGTIAGDNTVFIVIDSKEHVPAILQEIKDATE